MSELTPEELKIIAEGMGYELFPSVKYLDRFVYESEGRLLQYNPLTNDTQCREIMEKLKIAVRPIMDFWVASSHSRNTSKGKTINEAVCKAALEYFKK